MATGGLAGGGLSPAPRAALLAVCLVAVGLTATAAAPSPLATVAAVAVQVDSDVVGLLPMAPADRLGIRFIHSLDHLPVEDWYVVRGGELVQVSTRLVQFGAGMGHIAGEGRGHADGDWWEITGMERHIGTLVLRIGRASVDHRLLYRGQEVGLSACWPGQRLTLRPVWVASAQAMAGRTQLIAGHLPAGRHGCGR